MAGQTKFLTIVRDQQHEGLQKLSEQLNHLRAERPPPRAPSDRDETARPGDSSHEFADLAALSGTAPAMLALKAIQRSTDQHEKEKILHRFALESAIEA